MKFKKQFSKRCFTLPEILVAMMITTALAVFFVKTIDTVRRTIKLSSQLVDATAKTRFVFDRIALDLKNMPKRVDLDYYFTNEVTDADFMRVITQVKGPNSDRGISLVGYKLQQDSSGVYGLYRGVHGYNWDDVGFMGINDRGAVPRLMNLPEEIDLHEKDYELLASGIVKMGLAFQYKNDGKIYKRPPYYYYGTNQSVALLQMTNVASIVVSMVVMDLKDNSMLTPLISEKLAAKFTPPPEGIIPLAHWNTNLEHDFPNFSSDIPKPVAQSVRIYQRFYSMD